ncbi:TPA: hypothetical protein U2Q27_001700 [Burkholderia cepacia]|nr:hypothetical protein [Burkholderia cepacia]HEM8509673.1 hypothetical protein [Burkholderia cepacia]
MHDQQSCNEYEALTDASLFALLEEQALDCRQKSMTARLAAVTDVVEAILARGYDRSQVLDLLINAGWRFTPDSFDSALSRIRKRRLNADSNAQSQKRSLEFADVFASPRKNWRGK